MGGGDREWIWCEFEVGDAGWLMLRIGLDILGLKGLLRAWRPMGLISSRAIGVTKCSTGRVGCLAEMMGQYICLHSRFDFPDFALT